MTIRIDTEALNAKINELQEQQKIIAEVLEKFKNDTLVMDTYWSGNSGDMVKEELTRYTTVFDLINGKLIKFIVFLECVVNGYTDEDNMISNQIEIAAGVPIMNVGQASEATITDITDVPNGQAGSAGSSGVSFSDEYPINENGNDLASSIFGDGYQVIPDHGVTITVDTSNAPEDEFEVYPHHDITEDEFEVYPHHDPTITVDTSNAPEDEFEVYPHHDPTITVDTPTEVRDDGYGEYTVIPNHDNGTQYVTDRPYVPEEELYEAHIKTPWVLQDDGNGNYTRVPIDETTAIPTGQTMNADGLYDARTNSILQDYPGLVGQERPQVNFENTFNSNTNSTGSNSNLSPDIFSSAQEKPTIYFENETNSNAGQV